MHHGRERLRFVQSTAAQHEAAFAWNRFREGGTHRYQYIELRAMASASSAKLARAFQSDAAPACCTRAGAVGCDSTSILRYEGDCCVAQILNAGLVSCGDPVSSALQREQSILR